MNKEIKRTKKSLHIGCGRNYRVGSINIDLYDDSVADIIAHGSFLPFRSEAINSIETYHLIEHFDWVEVKYLLNEWFRVLEEEGDLILETPDLKKSIDKLTRLKDINTQADTLQYVYGVEMPGMRHKTGFNLKTLDNFLKRVGFYAIKKGKPLSHKYESGLRIKCKKGSKSTAPSNAILHDFRTNLTPYIFLNKIENINLLERNHLVPIESYLLSTTKKDHTSVYLMLLTKLITCNPLLAYEFCKALKDHSFFSEEEEYSRIKTKIKFFSEINFHQRIFTLWVLRKKNPGKLTENFKEFMKELESKILEVMTNSSDYERIFNYISSLETEKIPFFDLFFILEAGSIFLNQGIRAFNLKSLKKAKYLLLQSIKLNPDNFLTYWNLARLGVLTVDPELIDFYNSALTLTHNKKLKKMIRKEVTQIRKREICTEITKPIILP